MVAKVKSPRRRKCRVCGRIFQPKPYAWRQRVCSRKRCQRARRRENFQDWLRRNPDYFHRHPEKVVFWREGKRRWRAEHKVQLREYMRRYMRRYRRGRAGSKAKDERSGLIYVSR